MPVTLPAVNDTQTAHISFTDMEVEHLAKLLSILILQLEQGITEINRFVPSSHIVESLRRDLEHARDLLARIEAK